MALRVAELEALFTAKTDDIAKAEKLVKQTASRVEGKPITATVDADTSEALAGMDRVEAAAKKIVSEKTLATVDANISRAEKQFMRVYERLDYLKSVETNLDVKADVSRAEAQLQRVERNLKGLREARADMTVEADTEPAESKLKLFWRRMTGQAALAGADAGESGSKSLLQSMDAATRGAGERIGSKVGDGVEESLVSALTAIPIAGGIVLAGVAIGKALTGAVQDGLAVEVRTDRLQALAGLSEDDARRIGRGAGEAYANVFGESIEKNMDTARLALQFQILDEDATARDAQKVIQHLSGIADALDEDVRPAAAAVSTMIATGVARNAEHAFDIIATGAREGVNRSEDLLDTFTEYPALFQRLGLSGEEALGLINQGMRAGARNSDLAADALKEFQIRATDASESSAHGFELMGLNAEDMTAKIARGGADAREGLAQVLDGLRAIEDPVARNAAAVALFGTQAEDLGAALFAMDLSSAVEQLDGVTGAAQRMWDTMADNDATKIEQAQRNIETASEGIKGALAVAFAEPLGDFSDWVSQNRGPLLQFFLDLANGALDFAVTATESTGEFVSGPLADLVTGLSSAYAAFNWGQRSTELDELAESMRGFDDTTSDTVESIEEMRAKLNDFAEPQVQLGHLNDASVRLASSLDEVGSASGSMESQVRRALAALSDEVTAADAAGESQANLADRYRAGSQALLDQMVASGMTREAAQALIDTVLATPATAETEYSSNADAERGKVQALADRVVTLPDGTVVVYADTSPAENVISGFVSRWSDWVISMTTVPTAAQARGGILEFMARGGLRPMSPIAQVVPPSTYRVVGDRTDVDESYIPLDGSARSMAILLETMRRMGVAPASSAQASAVGSGVAVHVVDNGTYYSYDPSDVARERDERLRRALAVFVR